MTTETMHIYGPVNMHGNLLSGTTGVPTARSDIYANRGSAASFSGQYFLATDDPLPATGTLYYSDGTNWLLLSSPRGEMGRTTLTSNGSTSSGTSAVDVTGFTLALASFMTPRTLELRCRGPVQNTAADQFEVTVAGVGVITGCTTSVGTPGVVGKVGHGLVAGIQIQFTNLAGTTTGISTNTNYFVIAAGLTANTFEISATSGGSALNFGGGGEVNLSINVGLSVGLVAAYTTICRQTLPAAAMTAGIDTRIDVSAPVDIVALPVGTWNFKVTQRAANSGNGKFTSAATGVGSGSNYAYLTATLL